MDRKKLFSDYLFNMVRLVFNLGLPIIVLPFVLNRIGPENYGIFSYANSIVSYFCMAALLGIPEYASRAISREKGRSDIGKTVSEIFIIQFISVTLALLIYYFVFYPLFDYEYKSAFWLLSILIVANYLNVDWFYIGSQRFKFMSVRGMIFKILNVVAILLTIEKGDDYFKYTLITALTSLGNGVVKFSGILKYLQFRHLQIKRHVRPIFVLFSLSVAGLINGSLDKTITGYLVGPLYVGYYAIGFRLSRLVLQLFTALNDIIYPRVMNYLSTGDEKQTRKLIGFNMDYILMLSSPIVIGMILYSEDIIRLLFNAEMLPAVPSLIILTFIVPVQAVRRLIRQQVLLPRDRDRVILYITLIAIFSNVVLNFLLVPRYFHVGAAVATLMVELLDMSCGLIYIKKSFNYNMFSFRQIKYIIAGPVVLLPYYLLVQGQSLHLVALFGMVCFSAFLYFITLYILHDNIVYKLTHKYLKKSLKRGK